MILAGKAGKVQSWQRSTRKMIRKGWTRSCMALFLPFIMFFAFMLFLRSTSNSVATSNQLPSGLLPYGQLMGRFQAGGDRKTSSRNNSPPQKECINIEIDEEDSYKNIHQYTDPAQLRVIVLTYNRYKSLKKVLSSLQGLVLDGHNATLEIWVDRNKQNGLDGDAYRIARSFCWDRGPVFVHVHAQHVGIYGQWIRTWKPQAPGTLAEDELAIFIEDDVDISKYAYRWLRSAHKYYGDQTDMSGYSLQDENLKYARGSKKGKEIPKTGKGLVYLFPVAGSWGFAPHPTRWQEFQEWYLHKSEDKNFKPYVQDATLHTEWYKIFENKGQADTMWTIWFIRFCFERSLFSVYSNIPTHYNVTSGSLVSNRKEAGLHYLEKKRHMYKVPKLLQTWNDRFINFPPYNELKRIDYDGKVITNAKKLGE